MEIFSIKNLSFSYPNESEKAVNNVNLSIEQGDFLLLIGESGCGKTTLLKMLKPQLTPHGNISGEIFFNGNKNISDNKINPCEIGFIMQDIDSQIVTDKVYTELAFGLENMGLSSDEIRLKVSEFATYFGISDIFHKPTNELSGGQKQLLNLASVMVTNPKVLILDEPTAGLDPKGREEILNMIRDLHNQMKCTIILVSHSMDDVADYAERIIVMNHGEVFLDGTPKEVFSHKQELEEIGLAVPTVTDIMHQVKELGYPVDESVTTLSDAAEALVNLYHDVKKTI